MIKVLSASLSLLLLSTAASATDTWQDTLASARNQTVYFNAWGGSQVINDYIQWVADTVKTRYDVSLNHVKVSETGNVVARILAEKTAGRTENGSVDLIWINGENFKAMKDNALLGQPFSTELPNYQYVDTEGKPTTLFDFTTPVDGLEAPWGMAQLVFLHDTQRIKTPPKSMNELLALAKKQPGLVTYPAPPAFHGTTFLKQALLELSEQPEALYQPAEQADIEQVTAPLWAFLDQLHPLMWQSGKRFPSGGPEMTQLLNDGEIALSLSFNPNDASNAIAKGELPDSIRTHVHEGGTLGNTHFVAIPFNARARAGALVVANFLLSPEAQLKKQSIEVWGDPTVLAIGKLSAEDQARFAALPTGVATLSPEALGPVRREPDASWVEVIEKAWQARYAN